ncbi:hypothetical protein CANCADRAFT_57015 [Tortispora caseinolytica NRRL Y-17796]|uniref:non-specific serine/threonine protein kinase n=1 Tax=Tortispora caseinolytica NRRL Y-17796 TaxID=767744 RepID=A0A1E4TFJ0_9ASCO|nr:hypothetical protein CANCADRAFT_57015 [Tortispora caseinolytica NRRL Y-17796]
MLMQGKQERAYGRINYNYIRNEYLQDAFLELKNQDLQQEDTSISRSSEQDVSFEDSSSVHTAHAVPLHQYRVDPRSSENAGVSSYNPRLSIISLSESAKGHTYRTSANASAQGSPRNSASTRSSIPRSTAVSMNLTDLLSSDSETSSIHSSKSSNSNRRSIVSPVRASSSSVRTSIASSSFKPPISPDVNKPLPTRPQTSSPTHVASPIASLRRPPLSQIPQNRQVFNLRNQSSTYSLKDRFNSSGNNAYNLPKSSTRSSIAQPHHQYHHPTDLKSPPSHSDIRSLTSSSSRSSISSVLRPIMSKMPSKSNLSKIAGHFSRKSKNVHSIDKSLISEPQSVVTSASMSGLHDLKSQPSCDTLRRYAAVPSNTEEKALNHSAAPTTQSYTKTRRRLSALTSSTISQPTYSSGMQTLLSLCEQQDVIKFTRFVTDLRSNGTLVKYAEASYSEVFLYEKWDMSKSILKVIPFGALDKQPSLSGIVHEVRIAQTLSSLKGFAGIKHTHIVIGRYPSHLLYLWDCYDRDNNSENDRPDAYESEQLYCVIEMGFGGVDLEHYVLRSWKDASIIFWTLVKHLAAAEIVNEFEHRDLHWGNVLIEDDESLDLMEEFDKLMLEDGTLKKPNEVRNIGVHVVDYTLSRAQCKPVSSGGRAIIEYEVLDDSSLFNGHGDPQFEVYRQMRRYIKKQQGDATDYDIDWSMYCPVTNVLWLHYLLGKLINDKGLGKPRGYRKDASVSINTERGAYISLSLAYESTIYKKVMNGTSPQSSEQLLKWAKDQGLVPEI